MCELFCWKIRSKKPFPQLYQEKGLRGGAFFSEVLGEIFYGASLQQATK